MIRVKNITKQSFIDRCVMNYHGHILHLGYHEKGYYWARPNRWREGQILIAQTSISRFKKALSENSLLEKDSPLQK